MKRLSPIAPIVALALLSCDMKPSTAPEHGAGICPRFADGTVVPESTSVVSAHLVAFGRDTTVTVAYHQGGPIELGSLPAGTAFMVTLTGYKTFANGTPKALWWTSGRDTAHSEVLHTVYLDPLTTPAASSTLLLSTAVFQGDSLLFPANVYVTTNGSDPRDSGVAVLPGYFAIDSITTLKAAIRFPADPATGRTEDLWSTVQTFSFGIDPQDTITSLDTLVFSKERTMDTNTFFRQPKFHPDSTTVRDSIQSRAVDSIFMIASTKSKRAKIWYDGAIIADSVAHLVGTAQGINFQVTVENHGRSRTYSIMIAPFQETQFLQQALDSLFVSPGTFACNQFRVCELVVQPETDSVLVRAYHQPETIVGIGDSLFGDRTSMTIPVKHGLDTIRIGTTTADESRPMIYTIHVSRYLDPSYYLDTTYGTPWRATTYDTLVDARDGRKYRTVVVGTARWMAENLGYRADSSWCTISNTDSCKKYGRIYNWAAAMDTSAHFDSAAFASTAVRKGSCPSGWHLPTMAEWTTLLAAVPGSRASILLRAAGSVWPDLSGLDSLGFRILPAGSRYFYDPPQVPYIRTWEVGTAGRFWTSTEGSTPTKTAKALRFTTAAVPESSDRPKPEGYSIRCVADLPVTP